MGIFRTGDLTPSPIKRVDGSKTICTRNLKTIKRQVAEDFRKIKDDETISTRNLDANGKLKHIVSENSGVEIPENDVPENTIPENTIPENVQEQQPRRRGRPSRG